VCVGASSRTSHEDPFGNTIRITGTIAKDNPFRFSTKRTDDNTDLVLYEYRQYSPSLGRWISRDPIEEKGGGNLYRFGGNDPLRFVDGLGLRPISFVFDAFINGSRRGLWHNEPLNAFAQFGADDRDFGQFDELARNARVLPRHN
jgi:RHS repeat-associated protein